MNGYPPPYQTFPGVYPQQQQPEPINWLLIIAVVIGLAAMAGVAWYFFIKKPKDPIPFGTPRPGHTQLPVVAPAPKNDPKEVERVIVCGTLANICTGGDLSKEQYCFKERGKKCYDTGLWEEDVTAADTLNQYPNPTRMDEKQARARLGLL